MDRGSYRLHSTLFSHRRFDDFLEGISNRVPGRFDKSEDCNNRLVSQELELIGGVPAVREAQTGVLTFANFFLSPHSQACWCSCCRLSHHDRTSSCFQNQKDWIFRRRETIDEVWKECDE